MSSARNVAIVGTGQTRFQHRYPDVPYRELIFSAVSRVLEDAHASIADVDAVVYPMAPDALIGVRTRSAGRPTRPERSANPSFA